VLNVSRIDLRGTSRETKVLGFRFSKSVTDKFLWDHVKDTIDARKAAKAAKAAEAAEAQAA